MKSFIIALCILAGFTAQAQFTKATLQASGLTCSMCSKAVKNALEEVTFVDKVDVDLKKQEYLLSFKNGSAVDFDALSKAVEDAGFSVAALKVTATLPAVAIKPDDHIKIGDQYFHFLNTPAKTLNGATTFSLVDKHFVSAKAFKKWSAASKKECVQTGKAAACCAGEGMASDARVFHAVI